MGTKHYKTFQKEPEYQDYFKRQPLNDDELEALINCCQNFAERFIVIGLADTGCRASEFSSLRRKAIRWQDKQLSIIGKGNKLRLVPISNRFYPMLEKWFAVNEQVPSRTTIWRKLKVIAKRTQITKPVSPHVLRHTFGVRTSKAGIPMPAIMKAMGHSSIQVAQIYQNYSGTMVRDAFKDW